MDIESLQNFYPESIRKQNWNIDHTTGKYLYDFILEHGIHSVLELGTSVGVSTSYMAIALEKNKGSITTVESNTARRNTALENFRTLELNNIYSLSGHAPSILSELQDEYEMVFLDCIKLYYADIIRYILSNWKKTHFIIADNTISHHNALDDFFAVTSSLKTEKILIGSGLTVIHTPG